MFITASKIHDGRGWMPEGTVIELADDGTVTAIHENLVSEQVKHYEGILAPGFVNTHCHLELSHMKGVIPEHTGLTNFLQQVMRNRFGFTDEQKTEARHEAFNTMYNNGVVAVGDISNTNDTADLRATGKMHFHSFVEAIGFNELPQKQFDMAVSTCNNFAAQQATAILRQSIVPHAPYSVSHALFRMIDTHNAGSLISIHNQECRAENEFYETGKGDMHTMLNNLGIDDSFFHPSGIPSLPTYMRWMSPQHQFIFVHNTYSTTDDVIKAQRLLPDVYWCLCPNANLYIENTLPDIAMLIRDANNICIGTDSLSSNHELSIVSELYTLKTHYPNLNWETLLRWGTYNGARALQMQHLLGSIDEGKQPGIIQITGADTGTKPVVKRII